VLAERLAAEVETLVAACTSTAAWTQWPEDYTGPSLSRTTTLGAARERTGEPPPEELIGVAAVVAAAAAGQTGDAQLQALERRLGPGEKIIETPTSSSSPARNKELSVGARTPVADCSV
jgi:hypothetical protein